MSEHKPDERDIDDILASIDEMLQEKDAFPTPADPKKVKIQQALQQSEHTLALSSTPPLIAEHDAKDDHEQNDEAGEAEDEIDEDEQESITSRHRVLLTEALLEQTGQEILPLWVEQPTADKTEEKQDENTNEAQPEVEHTVDPAMANDVEEEADLEENIVPAAQDDDTLVIHRDQLEALVEVISRDLTRQVNQQMQDLLPKLVSASLVRHLASLKKDTE